MENGRSLISKKHVLTAIAAVLMTLILTLTGAYAVNKKAELCAKQSSYKLTSFDYMITSPSREQVEELKASSAVSAVFPCYNFTVKINGYELPVLMSESLDGYGITFFNEATRISGKASAEGIMLDETAAKELNVKVGDTVSFNMGGRLFTLPVSGIYMASTYTGLSDGVGLCVFTPEMKACYTKEMTYKLAFIEADGIAECEALLNGYIPKGEFIASYGTESEYVEKQKKSGSLSEERIKQTYAELKASFEVRSFPYAVSVKSELMKDVNDQIAARDGDVTYVAVITGIASFIAYAVLSVIFVSINKRDDEICVRDGAEHSKMLLGYTACILGGALFISIVTGGILLALASAKHYLSACVPIICLSALPVLLGALAAMIFTALHIGRLYKVDIK